MKCNQCKFVEMRVMVRNDKEVVYYCPKCKEISKISVQQEQEILNQENKTKEEYFENQKENDTTIL